MEYRTDSSYVQLENIQFLVLMRPVDDIAAWTFLDETTLNTVFDTVSEFIDDPDVLQTALSCLVDDQGFSSITLSTRNMEFELEQTTH